MRKSICLFVAFFLCLQANAAGSRKKSKKKVKVNICQVLLKKAEAICDESMCEDAEQAGEECIRDGDFHEGAQICIYDNELPKLVEAYNKRHPHKQINCDDI